MIRVNELRIGNWINHEGDFCKVTMIQEDYFKLKFEGLIIESFPEDVDPISTSEKWLRDFGFEGTHFLIAKGNFSYHIKNKTLRLFGISLHDSLWNEVHKLQNLVFALTSEELKTK